MCFRIQTWVPLENVCFGTHETHVFRGNAMRFAKNPPLHFLLRSKSLNIGSMTSKSPGRVPSGLLQVSETRYIGPATIQKKNTLTHSLLVGPTNNSLAVVNKSETLLKLKS